MPINAKKELQDILVGKAKIKCAQIRMGENYDSKKYSLPINYVEENLNEFLSSLDFEYHNGYGGQNLFGNIWLKDGTWLSRGEYDGSEWWEHIVIPEIPSELTL